MTSQPTHRRNVLQRVSQAPRLIFGLLMIALLVFALVIGTTGMAVGATEPPAQEPANANLVSAAVEEPEAEPVAVVEETAEAAEVEPIPLESAPAAPAAPAQTPESQPTPEPSVATSTPADSGGNGAASDPVTIPDTEVQEDQERSTNEPPAAAMALAAPDVLAADTQTSGYYHSDSDSSNPTTWYSSGSAATAAEILGFTTNVETVQNSNGTTSYFLNASWQREVAGGQQSWVIEYTNAPARWGKSQGTIDVPQPNRAQGGTAIRIEPFGNNNFSTSAQITTYNGQSTYPTVSKWGTLPKQAGAATATNSSPQTVTLRLDITSQVGAAGCPPTFGSTAYIRSWTGNMNIQAWSSPVQFDAPSSCPKTRDIVVNKRVLAEPSSIGNSVSVATNIGTNYAFTVGANFKLYENAGGAVGAATNFTCTVASNGACTITVTDVDFGKANYGKRYWVIEEAPVPGSAAASTYANPALYVGSYNGPTAVRPLVGLTQVVSGSTDAIIMPMTANNASDGTQITGSEIVQTPQPTVPQAGSFGAVANSLNNPTITPKCEAEELSIAIILDESASITGPQWTTFRNALVDGSDSVLGILSTAGAKATILGFGTQANQWHLGAANAPVAIPSNFSSSTIIPTTRPGGSSNATNWDAALSAFGASANKYDMVLFVTDGAPNVVFSSGNQVSSYDVTLRSLEAPIYAANTIKNAGTKLVAVGVGAGASGTQVAANLRAVSGTQVGSDYFQGDWETLKTTLSNIVNGATCNVPVTVSKTEIHANGDEVTNAIGWNFDANVTGQGTRIGAERQITGPVGTTGWTVKFSEPSGQTAAIGIDEEEVEGWTLSDVVCTSGGQSLQIARTGDSILLAGITTATQAVHCVFTNTQAAPKAELTLIKNVINQFGGQSLVSDWTLSATGPTAGVTGVTGANAITAAEVAPGAYTLEESGGPDGYEASAWSCKSGQVDVTVTASGVVTLEDNDKVTCTITNSDRAGEVDWSKVDEEGNLLSGSEWILRGPAGPATVDVAITDCTSGDCAATEDKDNTPGKFRVPGLSWGSYELIESLAPVGYNQATTSVSFVIAPQIDGEQSLELSLDPVVNTQILGTVTWTKVDSADTATLLGQSQWKLTGPSGDSSADVTVEDCIATSAAECTGPDKHPGAGQFNVVDLAWGDYVLTETAAPPGYKLSSADYPFSIGVGTDQALEVVLTAIENSPVTPPTIPLTGGIGRDFYALFGFGILALSAGTYVAMQQRSRRREV